MSNAQSLRVDINSESLKGLIYKSAEGKPDGRKYPKNRKPANKLKEEIRLQIYWLFYYCETEYKQADLAKMFKVNPAVVSRILKDREKYEKILSPDWDLLNPYLVNDEWGKK